MKASVERKKLSRSWIYVMPDFIIIGAQRGGTSFLYHTLCQHPCIIRVLKKEIHYFDINFNKGIKWYRIHFPSFLAKQNVKRYNKACITGEASPYYIFHPYAPKRISEKIPRVKLITLLRNPVDRAYSHYCYEVRMGRETLSFEEAINKENERLHGEVEKMLEDENYYSFSHHRYTYLSRGIYIDQLKVWGNLFPKEQMLIIKSEDLFKDSPAVLKKIMAFLNLPYHKLKEHDYKHYPYPKMNVSLRKRLADYFKPYNKKLYEFLGINFDWEKA